MSDPDDEMMDLHAVCIFFGGKESPLDPSTIYRGVLRGRYPKPVAITGSKRGNRWRRSECEAARDALIKARL